jgi:hypothetical protein
MADIFSTLLNLHDRNFRRFYLSLTFNTYNLNQTDFANLEKFAVFWMNRGKYGGLEARDLRFSVFLMY